MTLYGHFDCVRTLIFHPTDPILISGSEDGMVKVWTFGSEQASQRSIEPLVTFRHPCGIYALAIVPASEESSSSLSEASHPRFGTLGMLIVGDSEGTLTFWKLPPLASNKFRAYDDYVSLKLSTKVKAHDNVIWDIHVHPLSNSFLTVGADGFVHVWSIQDDAAIAKTSTCLLPKSKQSRSLLMPTSVTVLHADMKTCVVGYAAPLLAQFDLSTPGQQAPLLQRLFATGLSLDTNPLAAQVNQVVSHPTLPIVIAAFHDGGVRGFDVRGGDQLYHLTTSEDSGPVLSVAVDPSGLCLATGDQEGTLTFWSLETRSILTQHEEVHDTSVQTIVFHAALGICASGGSDSDIHVFQ